MKVTRVGLSVAFVVSQLLFADKDSTDFGVASTKDKIKENGLADLRLIWKDLGNHTKIRLQILHIKSPLPSAKKNIKVCVMLNDSSTY